MHYGKCYKCPICDKNVSSKQSLKEHIESMHDKKKFECSECGYSFKHGGNLNKHKKICHEGGDYKYSCKQCNKDFSTKQSLKRHTFSVHLGQKHTCEQCSKCFTTQSSLSIHIKHIHGGKKFSCDKCNSNFSSVSVLYNHKKNVHEKLTNVTKGAVRLLGG